MSYSILWQTGRVAGKVSSTEYTFPISTIYFFFFCFRDRYPPYSDEKLRRLLFLLKRRELPSLRIIPYIASFALGVASILLFRYTAKVKMQRPLIGPFWAKVCHQSLVPLVWLEMVCSFTLLHTFNFTPLSASDCQLSCDEEQERHFHVLQTEGTLAPLNIYMWDWREMKCKLK